MTKFKEILRLQQQGLSQRQIAVSLRISRNTIKEFFRRLESSDLSLPLNEHLSDQDIWNTLYGTKSEGTEYQRPDYDWVTKEMRHKGVTLLSLWGSYRLRCKEMDVQAYGYTQFCKRYSDYVKSKNTTMSIPRNPGENIEVDWAGSTAVPARSRYRRSNSRVPLCRNPVIQRVFLLRGVSQYEVACLDCRQCELRRVFRWYYCNIHPRQPEDRCGEG